MPLTPEDILAIREAFKEEFDSRIPGLKVFIRDEVREALSSELTPFKNEMLEFRNETQKNFDALFKRDETREQEFEVLKNQFEELEKKVA